MIFKAFLNKAVQFVASNPEHRGVQAIIYTVNQQNKQDGTEHSVAYFLENIDKKYAHTLVNLIPEAFPRRFRNDAGLYTYKNNLGAWCIEVKQQN